MENLVFFLYLIMMPFENFHPFGLNSLGTFARSPSFFFHIIGLVIMIVKTKGRIKLDEYGYFKSLFKLVLLVNSISLIMAAVLYFPIGRLAGQRTLDTIWQPMFYKFMTVAIIYYNYYMIKKVDFEFIKKTISIIIFYTLGLGYIQIAAILVGNPFKNILDELNMLGLTYSTNICLSSGKAILMFSEPSYAEILICGLLMPLICGDLITSRKKQKHIVILLAFLPIVIFNASSSLLTGVLICLSITVYIHFRDGTITKRQMIAFLTASGIALVALLGDRSLLNLIKQQVFEKPFDNTNLSSIQRTSIIRNCLLTFLGYPILGVGNGVQGFFYEKHLSANDYRSYEVRNTLKYENGVPGAGSWAGGWLSGYGIIGIIALVSFIKKTYRIICNYKGTTLYYSYIIGGVCFLVCSWFTASTTGGYLSIFILSIPVFAKHHFER